MRVVHEALLLAGALSLIGTTAAHAQKCTIDGQAALPITMQGSKPVMTTKVNGQEAHFVLDSGAFYSSMSAPMASSLGLKVTSANAFGNTRIGGIGGVRSVGLTVVHEFEFAGIRAKDIEFLVGGSTLEGNGLLGNNLLGSWDVEYDLANGRVVLVRTTNCTTANLAYWRKPGETSSVMDMPPTHRSETTGSLIVTDSPFMQVEGFVTVNGERLRAMLDTGSFESVITLRAAERAGVKPNSPGVTPAGAISGVGVGAEKSYSARFDSVGLGNHEEIKGAKLRMADFYLGDADLLLGADFFLTHHVFVSRATKKIYFTSNGGMLFEVALEGAAPATPDLSDPDALRRRAAGFAARHEYEPALTDLNRACDLSAGQPECFYDRGGVEVAMGKGSEALADFDHALSLRADFMPAMMPRAELKIANHDTAGAKVDLDTFDRLAARQADERMRLGLDYERAGDYAAAVHQFDLWIDSNGEDSKKVHGLDLRCRAKALENADLSNAMADCNHALSLVDKKFPEYRHIYASRGLVRLRGQDYDRALSDFNDALKEDDKNATALYGRSLARAHKNEPGAREDEEAARKASSETVDRLVAAGFRP